MWETSLLNLILFYPVCAFLFWIYLNPISVYWNYTISPGELKKTSTEGKMRIHTRTHGECWMGYWLGNEDENNRTSAFLSSSYYLQNLILTSPVNLLVSPRVATALPLPSKEGFHYTGHTATQTPPVRHSHAFRAARANRNVHQLHKTFRKAKVVGYHDFKGQKFRFASQPDRKRRESAEETFMCSIRQTHTGSIGWFQSPSSQANIYPKSYERDYSSAWGLDIRS